MESNVDAKTKMDFELPKSDMGENPFEVFKKFYRIYLPCRSQVAAEAGV